jgi:hypothetical protein
MNHSDDCARVAQRRALLKAGLAGSLLAITSPGWAATRLSESRAARVAIGYWRASAGIAGIGEIAAAWAGACGTDVTCVKRGLDETMVDALSQPSSAGRYQVRFLGGTALDALGSVRVDVLYGSASYGIWSAWTQSKRMHATSPVRARWDSFRGEMLRLTVGVGTRAESIVLPAQRGVYALTFDAGRGLPKWTELAMRAPDPAQPWRVELVQRSGAAIAVPHVLLALDHEVPPPA